MDNAIYFADREAEHCDYSKDERMLVELGFLYCIVTFIPVLPASLQPGGCPLHGENLGLQDPNSERCDFYTRSSLFGWGILPLHYRRTGVSGT
jgi:hypothetical protein